MRVQIDITIVIESMNVSYENAAEFWIDKESMRYDGVD